VIERFSLLEGDVIERFSLLEGDVIELFYWKDRSNDSPYWKIMHRMTLRCLESIGIM